MASRIETNHTHRENVLKNVTTPLAFFTLGLLVIEAILATLSLRAKETDLTILITGILLGFAMICLMVFAMARDPRLRRVLLGLSDISPVEAIYEMQLTKHDILVLNMMGASSATSFNDAAKLVSRNPDASPARRLKKFKRLNLVQFEKDLDEGPGYYLNRNGDRLAALIFHFASPFREHSLVD